MPEYAVYLYYLVFSVYLKPGLKICFAFSTYLYSAMSAEHSFYK